MKKIVSVIGTRPQFIKSGILNKEIKKHFNEIIVHTGQHFDINMSHNFFKELKIKNPDYNLGISKGTHGFQTGNMIIKIEEVLLKEKPDYVLLYGDTNSTLAGAIAAAKLFIPIIHVEAGLRSYKKEPEEINRIVADRFSKYLFCPTQTAVECLLKESISKGVYLVGDVMYDSILHYSKLSEKKSKIIQKLNLGKKQFIFLTMHRPLNVDDKKRLSSIFLALEKSKEKIIFPIHPRTKKQVEKFNIKIPSNVIAIEPTTYLETISLEKNAEKIITDSGGVQKEGYFLDTPCIILNDTTPWTECVRDGWNIVVGSNEKNILGAIKNFGPPNTKKSGYFGDGSACKKIVEILKNKA